MNVVTVGEWETFYACKKCKKEISWHTMMHSYGICPHCGNTDRGTIVDTVQGSKKEI